MAIYKRTCRECGAVFDGGPRAWYCPACRAERRRTASRLSKQRQARGMTRKIGSTDQCEICGGDYVVNSARQRYCKDCACAAWAEADREQGLAYYEDHKGTINPKRRDRRRKEPEARVCVVCGKKFSTTHPRKKTCSKECGKELLLMLNRQYHRDGRRKKRHKS